MHGRNEGDAPEGLAGQASRLQQSRQLLHHHQPSPAAGLGALGPPTAAPAASDQGLLLPLCWGLVLLLLLGLQVQVAWLAGPDRAGGAVSDGRVRMHAGRKAGLQLRVDKGYGELVTTT